MKLPQGRRFHDATRTFRVILDANACKRKYKINGKMVQVSLHPDVRRIFEGLNGTLETSLTEVARAAMQFYQTEVPLNLTPADYADQLKKLRHDFGLAFRATAASSLGLKPRSQ